MKNVYVAGIVCLVLSVVSSSSLVMTTEGQDPFQQIAQSTDVVWLEKIASSLSAAAQLKPAQGLAKHPKDLRTEAYARLGALGTWMSLRAAKRIENNVRKTTQTPEFVSLDGWTHPCWHWADPRIEPLAQVTEDGGTSYAVIMSSLLGDRDLFLISSKTPRNRDSWIRPKLVPNRVFLTVRQPRLALGEHGTLLFLFTQERPPERRWWDGTFEPHPEPPAIGPQQWELSIEGITRDSDGDGWTDAEEARLGLDPRNPDSDGDGVRDGSDVCPNYAPNLKERFSDEAQIIQKTFFATFGLTGSRYLLLVSGSSRRVQLWGYMGPVIYGPVADNWFKAHKEGGISVSWEITEKSWNKATVTIGDYEGPLAAGSQKVFLRRIGIEWFVIGREFGPVA